MTRSVGFQPAGAESSVPSAGSRLGWGARRARRRYPLKGQIAAAQRLPGKDAGGTNERHYSEE